MLIIVLPCGTMIFVNIFINFYRIDFMKKVYLFLVLCCLGFAGSVSAIGSAPAAPPTVTSSPNVTICAGSSTVLSVVSSTGVPTLTYSWAPAGSLSASTGTSVTASPLTTTIYTVTVTDGSGSTAIATTQVSVNPLPGVISGSPSICIGQIVFLTDLASGGSWSSSNISVATVGTGGDVSGLVAGTATISYTDPATGCAATQVETVITAPGTITGSLNICQGSSNLLGASPAGGSWNSPDPTVSVGAATGSVTGVSLGTADITYAVGSCFATTQVTVIATPAGITGAISLCTGDSVTLSDATAGGSWSSSAFWVASVGTGSGIVRGISGGTTTITYALPNGCYATYTENVTVSPTAIGGASSLCVGYPTTLTDGVSGGTWQSGAPGSAVVDPATGLVSGAAPGSVTIYYTIVGCTPVAHNITVNPIPSAVTGGDHLCDGDTTFLFELTPGGNWTSNDTSIAKVSPSSDPTTAYGIGVSLGVTTLSYTISGTGCYVTWQVTVNPAAPPIAGTDTICSTGIAWLTDIVGGGTWTSSNPAVATIDPVTGLLTGVLTGISYIVYTLPSGCRKSLLETCKPAIPPVSGTNEACSATTITLADAYTGSGTWSSANNFVVHINPLTGVLNALYPDTATVTFMVNEFQGCYARTIFTVDSLPIPVVTYNYAGHIASTYSFYSSYQWYDSRTGLIGGATGSAITLPHTNDSVRVTVIDGNGCAGTSQWYFHNATSVSNVNISDIRIYPNPATTTLHIDAPVKVRAVVSGVDGRSILEQVNATEVDLTHLANGLYMIALYDERGNMLVARKVTKQ